MTKCRERAHESIANALRAARHFVGEESPGDQPISEDEAKAAAEHRTQLPRPSEAEITKIAKRIGRPAE
jgi:hypothetical protein